MPLGLFRPRTIWWPTWRGWLVVLILFVAPVIAWVAYGESFLARTERLAADILVVESWIQEDGLHAAAAEFKSGGYRRLVLTGGLTGSKGALRRKDYTEKATRELLDAGIAREVIAVAPMEDVDAQRTHAMAVGVRSALQRDGLKPATLNVFTEGAHARRSQLVYAKAFRPDVKVGVVSWEYWKRDAPPWWTSSERALDLFKETLGYSYELFLSSGRHD